MYRGKWSLGMKGLEAMLPTVPTPPQGKRLPKGGQPQREGQGYSKSNRGKSQGQGHSKPRFEGQVCQTGQGRCQQENKASMEQEKGKKTNMDQSPLKNKELDPLLKINDDKSEENVAVDQKNESRKDVVAGVSTTTTSMYSSKYYELDETTVQEFWLRKPEPPQTVEVFPVGHPKNSPVQTVWTATQREIKYFEAKKFFVPAVPSENVMLTKDKHFYDTMHSNILYCGKFLVQEYTQGSMSSYPKFNYSVVEAFIPEFKQVELDRLASLYGPSFWIRTSETFGTNICEIAMDNLADTLHVQQSRVLILAGSNFQGASCVAAARHLASQGALVYISCVNSQGYDEPFIGSTPMDLNYEDIHVVYDMRAIKDEKFNVVILGVDDCLAPTTTIYSYREFLPGALVLLIDPPMISQSYKKLVENICQKPVGPIILVNAFRPTSYILEETADIYLVNIPTSKAYPLIGSGGSFMMVKPYLKKNMPMNEGYY